MARANIHREVSRSCNCWTPRLQHLHAIRPALLGLVRPLHGAGSLQGVGDRSARPLLWSGSRPDLAYSTSVAAAGSTRCTWPAAGPTCASSAWICRRSSYAVSTVGRESRCRRPGGVRRGQRARPTLPRSGLRPSVLRGFHQALAGSAAETRRMPSGAAAWRSRPGNGSRPIVQVRGCAELGP